MKPRILSGDRVTIDRRNEAFACAIFFRNAIRAGQSILLPYLDDYFSIRFRGNRVVRWCYKDLKLFQSTGVIFGHPSRSGATAIVRHSQGATLGKWSDFWGIIAGKLRPLEPEWKLFRDRVSYSYIWRTAKGIPATSAESTGTIPAPIFPTCPTLPDQTIDLRRLKLWENYRDRQAQEKNRKKKEISLSRGQSLPLQKVIILPQSIEFFLRKSFTRTEWKYLVYSPRKVYGNLVRSGFEMKPFKYFWLKIWLKSLKSIVNVWLMPALSWTRHSYPNLAQKKPISGANCELKICEHTEAE